MPKKADREMQVVVIKGSGFDQALQNAHSFCAKIITDKLNQNGIPAQAVQA